MIRDYSHRKDYKMCYADTCEKEASHYYKGFFGTFSLCKEHKDFFCPVEMSKEEADEVLDMVKSIGKIVDEMNIWNEKFNG